MPTRAFLGGVKANIRFWREQVEQVKDYQYTHLYPDRANIFQAIEIALKFSETQNQALSLALKIYDLVEFGGYWQEWLPILKLGQTVDRQTPANRIRLLNQLGFFHYLHLELDTGLQYYQKAETLAEENQDIYGIANTAYGFCNIFFQKKQYDEAEKHGKRALEFFILSKAPQNKIVAAHNILGLINLNVGKYSVSENHLSHAVKLATELNKPNLLATVISNLAETYREIQDYKQAQLLYHEALSHVENGDEPLLKYKIINNIGIICFLLENYMEAEIHFLSFDVEYLRRHGHWFLLAQRSNNLGNVYLKTHRLEEAETSLMTAADIWRKLQDEIQLGNTLGDLGEVVEKQKRLSEALSIYEQAIECLARYPQSAWANRLHRSIKLKHDRLTRHLTE